MPSARVSPANGREQMRQSIKDRSSDSSTQQETIKDDNRHPENLTPYQKVLRRLQTDEKWHQDITQGKRIGFYRIKEELGTGNFSQVKAAIHDLTKERVAVKILDKSKLDTKTQNMLAREILSMESLHHPNVIRLYEVLETLSKIYLVMEHANGGELFYRISQNGAFTEKAAKPLFAQITAAVDHMHFHNIVHRDLKAENVFFSSPNTVKVGDFGFSTHIKDSHEPLKTFCGSPPYAAPELFRDDSYQGPLVDVWALGVLLYFMLTATMPFKATTVAGLKKQILEGEYVIPQHLSTECHFLIFGILKQDPGTRTTLTQVKNSNWLTGETLPGPLPKMELQSDCNGNGLVLPEVEMDVRRKLKGFGIDDAMLEESNRKGSRCSVTGTYRIVLHRTLTESELSRPMSSDAVSSTKKAKKNKNRKSKTCTIL